VSERHLLGDSDLSASVFSDLLYHLSFLADDTSAVSVVGQHLQHHLTASTHQPHYITLYYHQHCHRQFTQPHCKIIHSQRDHYTSAHSYTVI